MLICRCEIYIFTSFSSEQPTRRDDRRLGAGLGERAQHQAEEEGDEGDLHLDRTMVRRRISDVNLVLKTVG